MKLSAIIPKFRTQMWYIWRFRNMRGEENQSGIVLFNPIIRPDGRIVMDGGIIYRNRRGNTDPGEGAMSIRDVELLEPV